MHVSSFALHINRCMVRILAETVRGAERPLQGGADMTRAEHLRIGRPVAAGSTNRWPQPCGARLATPNLGDFADCGPKVVVGRSMTPAAARPYLRYAATEALHAARLRRSVAGWPFLASSAAARLVAGPSARMTCSITPIALCHVGRRAVRAKMTGQSASPTTGRSRFRSATPSCARSKAICGMSWTNCSGRCREVRRSTS